MSLARRPGRCWYCGEQNLAVGDPREHIIPSAIGGVLTTDRVCLACNRAAARLDEQFAQDWRIIERRQAFSILDRQGRPPPHARGVDVVLPDGSPGRVDMRRGKFEPQPVTRSERVDEHTFRVVAATEDEALDRIEALRHELEEEGYEVVVGKPTRQLVPQGEVKVRLKVRQGVMLRMLAKLALGTASLVWPDDWLDSATARTLQDYVRGQNLPRDAEGVLGEPAAYDDDRLKAAVPPPMHLLCLRTVGGDRAAFIAALFGTTFWVTGFEDVGPPVDRAWLLDPVARSVEETDFGGIAMRAVEALSRRATDERRDNAGGLVSP